MRHKRFRRKKPDKCYFCKVGKEPDYKDPAVLRRYMSERGRILSANITGICAKHQRRLSQMIKRARLLALIPFIEQPL